MNKITDEVSTLTKLSTSTLNKILEKAMYCICEDVEETQLAKDGTHTTVLDIGIGTLTILVSEDSIKYHFTPSAKLNDAVVSTVSERKNPLVKAVDESLVSRVTNVYENLL
jgi:hypothetical protein